MTKKGSFSFDTVASDTTKDGVAPIATTDDRIHPNPKQRGLYISPVVVFIYILCSIALAAAVGLIVHFAHPDRKRICPATNCISSPQDIVVESYNGGDVGAAPCVNVTWELCLNLSQSFNHCPDHTATSTQTDLPHVPSESATQEPEAVTGLRLPTALKPYHYNVEIKPDIYTGNPDNFTFAGHVMMYVECVEETDLIVMHIKLYIENNSITINDVATGELLPFTDAVMDQGRKFFNITLDQPLKVGQKVVVSLSFHGPIYQDMAGMYWSEYPDNGQTKYMLSTQFETVDARKAFPCMDEPQLRATFNISIWRKEPMVALSNMPNYTSQDMGDGWIRDSFMKTPMTMPTYLVAFAVAEFEYIETYSTGGPSLKNKKHIRIWSKPEYIRNGYADYAANVSAPMFDYFEEYFNFTYILPKTDQITIPDFPAGAMENWGLITYRESRLLVDPRYSTAYDVWRFTKTIAHELLHQWLGNLVTVSWWGDLWLQEGAARYFENKAVQYARPEWHDTMTLTYLASSFHIALASDQNGNAHPIFNPDVESYAETEAMFSPISYDKGGAVYRMIQQYIFRDHSEAFDDAMRTYVQRFSYQNVQHDDLLSIFDEMAEQVGLDVNVSAMVYTWIKQTGYPVVTFTRSSDGASVHVTQKLFLINPERPREDVLPSQYGFKWEVPLSYITKHNPTTPVFDWLHMENKTIQLDTPLGSDDWLLGNYHQLGFYRVNYDDVTWEAIINQLLTDHQKIDVIHRGQIFDDGFDMARAFETDQIHVLRATEYLQLETEYLPWWVAIQSLRYSDALISAMSIYGDFRHYMATLVSNNYKRLGWDTQPILLDSFLQMVTIRASCKYGVLDCVSHATHLFAEWKKQPDNHTIINPDLRSTVYCIAIQQDVSGNDWDFLFKQYQDMHHDLERRVMRDALGCSMQTWILNRYFMLAGNADPSIFFMDHSAILHLVARNYPRGSLVAYDYLKQHWHNMTGYKYGVLSDIVTRYSTPYELEKFDDFVLDHPAIRSSYADAYKNMRYRIQANIRWRTLNEAKITDWLKQARERQTHKIAHLN